jgi:Rieske Fe-S protein
VSNDATNSVDGNCVSCAVNLAAVSRRDFVAFATLSAVAATLTACGGGGGDGGSTGPINPGVGTITVRLADFAGLATTGKAVKVQNSPPIAMIRATSGLVAYSLSCTHTGTTVDINADSSLTCPNHGARFTAEGIWTGGQRATNLVRLPVTLDSGGSTATITLG